MNKFFAVKIEAGHPRIIGKQRHSATRDVEWRIVNSKGRSVAQFVSPEFASEFPLWESQNLRPEKVIKSENRGVWDSLQDSGIVIGPAGNTD